MGTSGFGGVVWYVAWCVVWCGVVWHESESRCPAWDCKGRDHHGEPKAVDPSTPASSVELGGDLWILSLSLVGSEGSSDHLGTCHFLPFCCPLDLGSLGFYGGGRSGGGRPLWEWICPQDHRPSLPALPPTPLNSGPVREKGFVQATQLPCWACASCGTLSQPHPFL